MKFIIPVAILKLKAAVEITTRAKSHIGLVKTLHAAGSHYLPMVVARTPPTLAIKEEDPTPAFRTVVGMSSAM